MKKLMLIFIIFLVTGCHYQEIDSLAVVSTLAIDYNDNNYYLTLEIKEVKEKNVLSSYLIDTQGETIIMALKKANIIFNKSLYFANLDILLLTPNALDKIEEITNYINNNYDFAFNFNIALVNKPEQVMNHIIQQNYIFGDYMLNTFKKDINEKFDIIYPDYLSNYLDNNLIIPKIIFNDNNFSFSLVRGLYE